MSGVKIIQLTDLHLQLDETVEYKGVYPDQHLRQCLAWVAKQDYDLLLLTGDLSHAGYESAYQRLLGYMQDIEKPWYWLPGNHDDAQLMTGMHDQDVDSVRCLQAGNWQLILLNSTHEPDGRGSGSVSPAHLQQLACQISASDGAHTMVVLHHNPIAVDSTWQDEIMLENAAAFLQVLDADTHHQVKAVLCGHIHQEQDVQRNNVRFLGSPATSVQFAIKQHQFLLQPELGPGLRRLTLYDDGRIDTEVVRLAKLTQDAH